MHNKDCCKTKHSTTKQNTARQHDTTQHDSTPDTTQYNTIQLNTTQHNTTQKHNLTQHNTTQHNTTILAFYIGLSSIKSHEKAREKKSALTFQEQEQSRFKKLFRKFLIFHNLVQ